MKLFKKKIIYRKVNNKDLPKVINFLKKYFKKKISKTFYKQRYFKNYSQSYICLCDDKIIGHVGFVRYMINKNILNKKYIFSRHSSLIHPNFRKFGIFKKLCLYSIGKIKSNSNNVGFIIWPNDNNFLRFKNISKINYKNNHLLQLIRNKSFKKSSKKFEINHIKIVMRYKNQGVFEKNENYLKWKYFLKQDNSKYFINFFKSNNKLESISIYDFNQKKQLRVLDFFGQKKHYINHINDLLQYNRYIIFFHNLYSSKNCTMKKKYQTIAYFFSKKVKKIFLKKKNLLTLGDTDTFINYEKIK
tara:strand:- start:48 stop:953 length:906 start_codon:yes stop_codon:yes gene_type:complete